MKSLSLKWNEQGCLFGNGEVLRIVQNMEIVNAYKKSHYGVHLKKVAEGKREV